MREKVIPSVSLCFTIFCFTTFQSTFEEKWTRIYNEECSVILLTGNN